MNPSSNRGLGFGFDRDKPEEVQTPFDIAEQKAVKAIQKHSMNIDGYQRNNQSRPCIQYGFK